RGGNREGSAPTHPPTPLGGDVRTITAVGTAVLATLAAAVPLGAAAADVPLRTEVVQREQGRGELLLVRQRTLGGTRYELRLGHDADIRFHPVRTPPALPSGPPRLAGVDWGEDGVELGFDSGHTAGVPADAYLGGRGVAPDRPLLAWSAVSGEHIGILGGGIVGLALARSPTRAPAGA